MTAISIPVFKVYRKCWNFLKVNIVFKHSSCFIKRKEMCLFIWVYS